MSKEIAMYSNIISLKLNETKQVGPPLLLLSFTSSSPLSSSALCQSACCGFLFSVLRRSHRCTSTTCLTTPSLHVSLQFPQVFSQSLLFKQAREADGPRKQADHLQIFTFSSKSKSLVSSQICSRSSVVTPPSCLPSVRDD